MKIIKFLCIVMIIIPFFTSCKTAEFNAVSEKATKLEKENAQLKKELAEARQIATEAEAKANKSMEEIQKYSMIAGQNAAESQKYQSEAQKLQVLYDECINKKKN